MLQCFQRYPIEFESKCLIGDYNSLNCNRFFVDSDFSPSTNLVFILLFVLRHWTSEYVTVHYGCEVDDLVQASYSEILLLWTLSDSFCTTDMLFLSKGGWGVIVPFQKFYHHWTLLANTLLRFSEIFKFSAFFLSKGLLIRPICFLFGFHKLFR